MISEIESEVVHWINRVVIGLGLCPFASKPMLNNLVKIVISHAESDFDLLTDLQSELLKIDRIEAEQLETTLIVIPKYLADFSDFNQFLNQTDLLLEQEGWTGNYQIATFHPNYQFKDTKSTDKENLTNRAPYPILQILREQSISRYLEDYSDPAEIIQRNIKTMQGLSNKQQVQLFPHLFLNQQD